MSQTLILASIGFIIVFGIGIGWLGLNIIRRKRFVRSLLSLPRERRFFWYLLRKRGFEVLNYHQIRNFSIFIDNSESHQKNYSLKSDFLAKKKGHKYACLFCNTYEERELLKIYFTYRNIFGVHGVVFYYPNERNLVIWKNKKADV